MSDEFEQAVEDLTNERAGWVTRRDAAQALGKLAARATETLRKHQEDSDRDVRPVVQEALGWVKASLDGVAPVAQVRAYSLEELVRYIEKPGRRDVEPSGDGFAITVSLRDGRKQVLTVEPGTSQLGQKTILVKTRCGVAREKAYAWALRNNTGFTHCSMALVDEDGTEYLEMVNAFLAEAVTPAEFKSCIKEIAFYADWVEQKLGDEDVH